MRIKQHLCECAVCEAEWKQVEALQNLLKESPVPAPRAGFEERMFAKLPNAQSGQQTVSHKKAFVAGFGSALAASIALFVVIGLLNQPVTKPAAVPNITLSLYETKKVQMVFDVPEAVADATFSMQLPAHIEIAGSKGLNYIEWKTALKKGKNMLSLPVVAQMSQSGELVAKIKYGTKEKVFRLQLDIKPVEQGMLNNISQDVV
jgi:hypothetical protein